MSCNHKWVEYQPFQGEPYRCCANAGCGIKFDDFIKEKYKGVVDTTDPTSVWAGTPWGDMELPTGAKQIVAPLKPPPPKGWTPVKLAEYFHPVRIAYELTDEN